MTKRALVCGAGISGLTAGIYLTRLGWNVTVFEKDPELRTAGAGLNLWPNGMRVLEKIGLRSALATVATSLDYYRTFSSTGDVIAVEDVRNWRERYGAPLCGIYRRDLSRILLEALGSEKLRDGHQLVSVEQDDDVVCTFANGERARGDLVLGADGIGSIVRASIFGEQEFSTDVLVRWRGLFNLADVDVDPLSEAEVWGEDGHLGYLPIGGGRAYWFAAAYGITHDPDAVIGPLDDVGGLSEVCNALQDYPAHWKSCGSILEIAESFGKRGILAAEDFGPLPILLSTANADYVRDFVHRTLGAIIEYDATHDTRFLATLKAYFESGCRNQQCADALEIHVTTLRYRLTRIAELFGLDLESATKRFDVELALRLTDLCRT